MKEVSIYQMDLAMMYSMPSISLLDKGIGVETLSSMYKSGEFYENCYTYNTTKEDIDYILESTFEECNMNSDVICEFLYRSMTPGDIITINEKAYIVMPSGFRQI